MKEDVTLATTRGQADAGEELQQLKAIIAEQQHRLEALEAHSEVQNGEDTKDKRSTRRQMLRLAGATLIGAAGTAALRAIPAAAADGNTVTVGTVFTETLGLPTGVNGSSASYNVAVAGYAGTGGAGLYGVGGHRGIGVVGSGGAYGVGVEGTAPSNFSTGVIGTSGYGGVGVRAISSTTFGVGVVAAGNTGVEGFGYNGGIGVLGSSNATGVFGVGSPGVFAKTSATSSRALFAYTTATNSVAIEARNMNPAGIFSGAAPAISAHSLKAMGTISYGYLGGVWGNSSSTFSSGVMAVGYQGGPDLKLRGSGRMVQVPNIGGGVGAPSFTSKTGYFEMVRAGDGAMWINRGTGALQASWKRINAVRVDSSDGTGSPFKPFRVIDTRIGPIKSAGSLTSVPVAGTGTLTSSIPSDAVAIVGNLTAVDYTGAGFLAIMPGGITVGVAPGDYNPATDPSSVNFIVGQAAIANGFVCGLVAGAVQVYVGDQSSHFIIDVTGYMQ